MNKIHIQAALLAAVLMTGTVGIAQAGTRDDIKAIQQDIEMLNQGQEQIQKDLAEIKKLLEQGARAAPGQAPFRPKDLVVGESATRGSDDAPVTLFEFSDYQCPYCRRHATTVMPGIIEEYVDSGKVRIVMREFPIENIHRRAFAAAQAALCAGSQGKYWDMHDLMFANQSQLSDENFKSHGETLGLEAAAFESCLADDETSERIRANQKEGQSMGISGTPSFVIGLTNAEDSNKVQVTKYIRGAQPLPAFQAAIEDLLESAEGQE